MTARARTRDEEIRRQVSARRQGGQPTWTRDPIPTGVLRALTAAIHTQAAQETLREGQCAWVRVHDVGVGRPRAGILAVAENLDLAQAAAEEDNEIAAGEHRPGATRFDRRTYTLQLTGGQIVLRDGDTILDQRPW